MSKKVSNSLSKKEIDKLFITEYMPCIREAEKKYTIGKVFRDIPLRVQEYQYFLTCLREEGRITAKQEGMCCIPYHLVK